MQVTITFVFVELKYIPLIINTDLWVFPSMFGVEGFVLRLVYKRELNYEKGKKLGKKKNKRRS
jgi:cytochrome c-type biogenesis protein CcmH/NrfF